MKLYSNQSLNELSQNAAQSERKRCNLNIHEQLEDEVQRLFLAFEPETYVRPHRHPQAHKWELFILLKGDIDMLIFSDNGELKQRLNLSDTGYRAVEIPPDTWHSYISNKSGSQALEIKQGAYIPQSAHDFAPWAPDEKDPQAADFLAIMRKLQVAT